MQVVNTVMEFKRVAIRIAKDVKERRDKLVASRICLVCEEKYDGKPSRRGECPTCRQYTTRLIERGIRTEESLIQEGKLLENPDIPRGGARKAHAKRQALARDNN